MTSISEKLADCLTGGAYSRIIKRNRALVKAISDAKAEADARYEALQAIADQETPGANATVKRMAKIAREGMKSNVD